MNAFIQQEKEGQRAKSLFHLHMRHRLVLPTPDSLARFRTSNLVISSTYFSPSCVSVRSNPHPHVANDSRGVIARSVDDSRGVIARSGWSSNIYRFSLHCSSAGMIGMLQHRSGKSLVHTGFHSLKTDLSLKGSSMRSQYLPIQHFRL